MIVCLLLIYEAAFNQAITKQNLKTEDIFGSQQFFAKTVSELTSMKDGERYTDVTETGILIYDYKTGNVLDTLVSDSVLRTANGGTFDFSEYALNDDETKILFTTGAESIYRHSFRAAYFVYDLKSKTLTPVSANGKQMYATFSPAGTKIAFVRDNNIFVKDLISGEEKQITTDGKKNLVINGATDWVYEEEFSFDCAYQWNVDGTCIAYYRFDESEVKEFTLTYYDSLYPRLETYKYPKAGEKNSTVDLYIYNLTNNKKTRINTGSENDQYIPRIKWTQDPNTLSYLRMNRHQNVCELYFTFASAGITQLVMKEENSSFIEINDDLTFLEDKKSFIWTSSKSGYNHIYLYSITGTLLKQITSGSWDVTKLCGYDEDSRTFYFVSTEVSPMDRQVYSIDMTGKKKLLSPDKGHNAAGFSSTYKYFVNTHSDANDPYSCAVYSNDGKQIRVLQENKDVKENMDKFNLSNSSFFTFKNDASVDLNGWMIKPPDFNPSKKYPVLVYVYGGPGVQTVNNAWGSTNYFWHQMLAQKGYIVVSVDNRGTPGRGLDFANCIYKDMGKFEVDDQVALAKYLASQTFVDKDRIGVWGWSFGGYMTSLLMTKGADYFKMGIAVAPVINWRYYDSIYTERYLQTPQENPKGYDDNSPINFAKLMKGKFLLVHGTTDDNVHFQNSMEFVKALTKEKKQFETFFYPNKNHGLPGMRLHLYTMMTEFIEKNL